MIRKTDQQHHTPTKPTKLHTYTNLKYHTQTPSYTHTDLQHPTPTQTYNILHPHKPTTSFTHTNQQSISGSAAGV